MPNCNCCANQNCSGNPVELSQCKKKSMRIIPRPFKTPLLIHLVDSDQGDAVMKVLSMVGLVLKEVKDYPWFKLVNY
jgi:hypothetical protein